MNEIRQQIREAERNAQAMAELAIGLWALAILVAVAGAIWIFRDAEARGKNGIAAGIITLTSVFYGVPLTVMVLCAWVIVRPAKTRVELKTMNRQLPVKLPADLVAASDSGQFPQDLEIVT